MLPPRRKLARPLYVRIPWNRYIPNDSDTAPACRHRPSMVHRSKLFEIEIEHRKISAYHD